MGGSRQRQAKHTCFRRSASTPRITPVPLTRSYEALMGFQVSSNCKGDRAPPADSRSRKPKFLRSGSLRFNCLFRICDKLGSLKKATVAGSKLWTAVHSNGPPPPRPEQASRNVCGNGTGVRELLHRKASPSLPVLPWVEHGLRCINRTTRHPAHMSPKLNIRHRYWAGSPALFSKPTSAKRRADVGLQKRYFVAGGLVGLRSRDNPNNI